MARFSKDWIKASAQTKENQITNHSFSETTKIVCRNKRADYFSFKFRIWY